MKSDNEISALIKLLEDPDSAVFESVSDNLMSQGTSIFQNWRKHGNIRSMNSYSSELKDLIQNIQQSSTFNELAKWNNKGSN